MMSHVRFVYFIFLIITMIPERELQLLDVPFLYEKLISFIFPKEPGIVRVRKMEENNELKGEPVLDFIGLVEIYGYSAEEHKLTTQDGYNLVIHRITGTPHSENRKNKKIVFIQHGAASSSDSWVIFGPSKDLAFLLADLGYDVWLGNFRGNTYCRSHVKLTTYDREFWQFSFHEMGTQDLPAMIDYVLNHTDQKSLRYVGFSLGTTTLFVLLSMKPEYNEKIELAVCLSPIALWAEVKPSLMRLLMFVPTLKAFLDKHGVYDILPQSAMLIKLGRVLCHDNAITQPICIAIMFTLVGSDPPQINTTILPFLYTYCPAGASMQTVINFYQNVVSNKFQSYDYGSVGNYERYKQKTPINYDLEKITIPMALFYGLNDNMGRKLNTLKLSRRLRNVILTEEVPYKTFNHLDFMWAINVKPLLYDRVIQIIQNFDANLTASLQ